MREFSDGYDSTVPSSIHPSLNVLGGFIGRNREKNVREVRTITAAREVPGTPGFHLEIVCDVRRLDGRDGNADIVKVAGSTATGLSVQIVYESVPPRDPAGGPDGYFDLIPGAVDRFLALRQSIETPDTQLLS